IKRLHTESLNSPEAIRRFLDEARITARLQHPGIPPIHAVGTAADGTPFIAMKLIQGQTLHDLIQGETPVPFETIFESLCQAVGYAHAQGMIHRDLKPRNIMVGAFGEVQVMDWGLAKSLRANEKGLPEADSDSRHSAEATCAGSVLGTPAYMPPEQARGELATLTEQADVFGLGAILCAMLTGFAPFRGPSTQSILKSAGAGDLTDAMSRLNSCQRPPEWIALCKHCLAPQAADRPADANVLARMVGQLRQEALEKARTLELAQARATTRRKWLVGSTLTIGVVMATGLFVAMILARDAIHAKTVAQDKSLELSRSLGVVERRTSQALSAYQQMITSIQDRLDTAPGTQALRKELLQSARQGLTIILAEQDPDARPDPVLVWCHIRLGDLEREAGELNSAEEQYRRAIAVAEAVQRTTEDSLVADRNLAAVLQKLGDLALLRNQLGVAETNYQKSAELLRPLADHPTRRAEFERDYGISLDKLGDLALAQGNLAAAKLHYEAKRTLAARRAEEFPMEAQAQRDLAVSCTNLGDLLLGTNRPAALGYYLQALGLLERIAQAAPNDIAAKRDLCVLQNNLGDAQRQAGNLPAARNACEQAVAISKELVAAEPQNPEALRDLSISTDRLGKVLLQEGNPAAGLAQFELARQYRVALVARQPTNSEWQTDLFFSHFKIGQAHLAAGHPEAARPWFDRATEQLSQFQKQGWYTTPEQQMGTGTFGQWQAELAKVQARLHRPKREPAPAPRSAQK
ncbi:MAG: protein kinase domain-containing protein, partial [Gemmataceae bacterium]